MRQALFLFLLLWVIAIHAFVDAEAQAAFDGCGRVFDALLVGFAEFFRERSQDMVDDVMVRQGPANADAEAGKVRTAVGEKALDAV